LQVSQLPLQEKIHIAYQAKKSYFLYRFVNFFYTIAMIPLSEKKIHKIGRIDQIVRDYFLGHPDQKEILAKELMPLFIEKGIFFKNHRDGLPIRSLLRHLDQDNKLSLLKHVQVVRHAVNRNWYFQSDDH